MKHSMFLPLLIAAAALTACDKPAPPPEAHIESAGEAMRNDNAAIAVRLAEQKAATDKAFEQNRAKAERQRYVDALRAVSTRWAEAFDAAAATARADLAEPIKKLQSIKAEAEAVEVDDCTGGARATLQSAMSVSIEAFSMFQNDGVKTVEASGQKLQQGTDQLLAAQKEIVVCLNK